MRKIPEEKYVVVVWEYGYNENEFEMIEAIGPMSQEEARLLSYQFDHANYVELKEKGDK